MSEHPDDDLRRLFEEARRADEGSAPPFERLMERERRGRPEALRRIGRLLAAAAAILVLAIAVRLLYRVPPPSSAPVGQTPSGIEAWTPPTSTLLRVPFTDLYDSTPVLLEPVPDYSSLLAKEDEKGKRS